MGAWGGTLVKVSHEYSTAVIDQLPAICRLLAGKGLDTQMADGLGFKSGPWVLG